jgi:uncharacterized protein YifE (UPF0438 family)
MSPSLSSFESLSYTSSTVNLAFFGDGFLRFDFCLVPTDVFLTSSSSSIALLTSSTTFSSSTDKMWMKYMKVIQMKKAMETLIKIF